MRLGAGQIRRILLAVIMTLSMLSIAPAAADSKPDQQVPPAQVESALQIIAEIMPGNAQRLKELREKDPEQFQQLLRRLFDQRVGVLVRLKERDPDYFVYKFAERKLESKAYILSRRIKKSDPKQVAPLQAQLRQMLHELFGARLRTREFELARLESRLESLRAQVKQQRDQKQALIDKRYDELLTNQTGRDASPKPQDGSSSPGDTDSAQTLARPRDKRPITKPKGKDELTVEQIDQILAVINAHRPKLADELRALRKHDPEQFARAMSQHAPRLRQLMLKRRQDPKGFDLQTREQQLHAEAVELARKIGGKELHEAQTVREKLRMVLEKQFDARQELLQHELAKLEKRINQARADLEAQRTKEDAFVNHRYNNLTRADKQ